jgi:hypothetical protein
MKPMQTKQQAKFTAALASVLSDDPNEIRDKTAQAKDETPSPHKRWRYDPVESQR